jgi:D-alanine-D-alanine ligase
VIETSDRTRRRAAELARTTVVVLYGGTSTEREVSLSSGRAVLAALAPAAGVPAALLGVEVRADGRWVVGEQALPPARALGALPEDTLFFLGLHGGDGEDGTLQGFLRSARRRHTGSGVAASSLCMDKHLSRLCFAAAGLAVAPGALVRAADAAAPSAALLARLGSLGAAPWYVKPNRGGSSVATTRAAGEEQLDAGLRAASAGGSDVLVESHVAGLETTCGVIGNRGGPLRALPIVEIVPHEGRFFDYEEKYGEGGAREVCPPEHLTRAAQERLAGLALDAYRAAGCDGYARIDFIVPGDAASCEPVVLEANTLPGFTPRSLLPQAAAAAGVDFRSLCLELCALALEAR